MAIKRNIVVLVLCALFLAPAYAESVKDLQKKQKKLQEEIEQTNKMLKQTKKDETATMNKLQLIGQNIKTQKKLINTLDNEITALNREMTHLNATRDSLQKVLEGYKNGLRGDGAAEPLCPHAAVPVAIPAQQRQFSAVSPPCQVLARICPLSSGAGEAHREHAGGDRYPERPAAGEQERQTDCA